MEAPQAHAWIHAQGSCCYCHGITSELLIALWQCRGTWDPLPEFAWGLCRAPNSGICRFPFSLDTMAVVVDVILLSGQGVSLKADLTEKVQAW